MRLRKRDGAREQIALDQVVDDAVLQRARRGHRFAVGAHLERLHRSAQPWQTLRATRARNDAQQHLRLSDPGVPGRHAVVAGHGQLETAAEGVAVNGGDDRSELKVITMFLFRTSEKSLKPVDLENPEARWVDRSKVGQLLTHEKDKEFFGGVQF